MREQLLKVVQDAQEIPEGVYQKILGTFLAFVILVGMVALGDLTEIIWMVGILLVLTGIIWSGSRNINWMK